MKKKNAKKFFKTCGICLTYVVWALASFIASQYVVTYLIYFIVGQAINEPLWVTICAAIYYPLSLFLIIFVPYRLFKKWKTNREELGLRDLPTWTDIGLAPIGLIASLLIGMALLAIFSLFPWFDGNQEQLTGFNGMLYNFGDKIAAFFTLVIAAPIAEEVIFRGWLYGKLRAKLNLPTAMFIVSLAFAVVHGQWNVGINVFALSLVLCGLREITGTIYSGILVHMIKNGLAFYLLYILGIS